MKKNDFIELTKNCFVHKEFKDEFVRMGLSSIDSVFYFNSGKSLYKDNLGSFRTRIRFETKNSRKTCFLKRYANPPVLFQIKNWLAHLRRNPTSIYDFQPSEILSAAGINTPAVAAYGYKWGLLFEQKSFVITEQIPDALSLEQKLPDCFTGPKSQADNRLRKEFIKSLASLIRKFHQTGLRHRDLYLCHIFLANTGRFYIIDLARCFKPLLLGRRYQIKDIAQLHYSSPKKYFSKTDRLRFYLEYMDIKKLAKADKAFIKKACSKALKIAVREKKYGRKAPFME